MKRIFPVISILVFLSLLGIIFFQVMWSRQAFMDKQGHLSEIIQIVTVNVGQELVDEHAKDVPFLSRRSSDLLPPLNIFSNSIARHYSVQEINDRIHKAFKRYGINHISFEFQISSESLTGDVLQSKNFFHALTDSVHNKSISIVYPLISPSGSLSEGLVPEEILTIVVPEQSVDRLVWQNMTWMIVGSLVLVLIIFAAFYITIRALLNQKKLSEIKSDFINNMTHEFKTPLATISLAVDALKNEKVAGDKQKISYFTGIIKDENKRMNKQVESILQAALIDRQEMQLTLKPGHAHEMITTAVNNVQLPLKNIGGRIEVKLDAKNDTIMADDVNFTNIINNLLDNAIKYSKENLLIKLTTTNAGNYLRVRIEDNGIGMNKETQQRIFEKFYRAHTGNLHNVKGFGLGLSYVKSVVLAHSGRIKTESTLGKGSRFTLDFPLARQ